MDLYNLEMDEELEDRMSETWGSQSNDEDGDGMLTDNDNSNLSALRENISKKGKHSYYYAHSSKIDGPEWDGKEEPRKLAEFVATPSSEVTPSLSISEYSWLDEDDSVKLYIEQVDAHKIDDANISLVSLFVFIYSFEFVIIFISIILCNILCYYLKYSVVFH